MNMPVVRLKESHENFQLVLNAYHEGCKNDCCPLLVAAVSDVILRHPEHLARWRKLMSDLFTAETQRRLPDVKIHVGKMNELN